MAKKPDRTKYVRHLRLRGISAGESPYIRWCTKLGVKKHDLALRQNLDKGFHTWDSLSHIDLRDTCYRQGIAGFVKWGVLEEDLKATLQSGDGKGKEKKVEGTP